MFISLKKQHGVGLVEVLISLVILAIGVLGFLALQYRAIEANSEGGNRVIAMNLARDLAERMRVNPSQLSSYPKLIVDAKSQNAASTSCYQNYCDASQLAVFDASQVVASAKSFAMSINMLPCNGNENERKCIYVAWGETSATNGSELQDCTDGSKYQTNSTCLIMEAY